MKLHFKSDRDSDFLRAYSEVISSYGVIAPYICKSQLIRETIEKSPTQFYVSYPQAFRVLSRMIKGGETEIRRPEKKLMYIEMAELVKSKLATSDMPMHQAIYEVINMPPSKFYITFESAQLLLYTLLKNKA